MVETVLTGDYRPRQMLVAFTVVGMIGLIVATALRLSMDLTLVVPAKTAMGILPSIAAPWFWQWRRWRGQAWVEATSYVSFVTLAQMVMEVNVIGTLYVVPLIGVLYRDWRLSVYSGLLGAMTGVGLLPLAQPWGPHLLLNSGAHFLLMFGSTLLFTRVTMLTRRAEGTVARAHLMEQMAQQWAVSIEARDHYTGGHVERVMAYALRLAPLVPDLGMDLRTFRLACILHDVGKVGVPDHILNKPGALTPEEREVIEGHAALGYEMVVRTGASPQVAAVVRHHHERWDGQGYPDGLMGRAIPKAARVLAVADAFDAMTSQRSYRRAISPEDALQEIRRCSGAQFDPEVVSLFEQVYPQWAALCEGGMRSDPRLSEGPAGPGTACALPTSKPGGQGRSNPAQ